MQKGYDPNGFIWCRYDICNFIWIYGSVSNVAKKFPNVKFEHAAGYRTADNVSTYSADSMKEDQL